MAASRSTYELKRFRRSSDPGFTEALKIYSHFTGAEIYTKSNEITAWVDRTESTFDGEFATFGFLRNEQVVGFAELAYLKRSRLVVVDYVVLHKDARGHNVFYEFAEQLRDHVNEHYPEYRYVVAEIQGAQTTLGRTGSSETLVRLLKWLGFHVVLAPYIQPRLDLDYAESEAAGFLMISSREPVESMKRESYLAIVHAIYYDYYVPWMNRYPNLKKGYKAHIRGLYTQIEGAVANEFIRVNGHAMEIVLPKVRSIESNSPNRQTIVSAGLSGLIFLALSGVLMTFKTLTNEPTSTFIECESFALIATLCLFALFSDRARETLKMFMDYASGKSARNSKPSVTQGPTEPTTHQGERIELPPAG